MSCSKTEPKDTTQEDGGEVNFTLQEIDVDWTRGTSVDAATDITSVGVYAVRNSDDLEDKSYEKSLYINNLSAVQSDGIWQFSPSLYYPVGETLKFFAYSPYVNSSVNGISSEFDLDSEEMTLTYNAPTVDARNQPDILVSSGIGNQNGDGGLDLNYSHALTKITMSAKAKSLPLIEVTGVDGELSYVEPEFYIVRFTMGYIATIGKLTCSADKDGVITIGDATNASGPWIIDQGTRSSVIASNAYTLPDPTGTYSDEDKGEAIHRDAVKLNTTSCENVMGGQALFMIPQRIENLPEDVYPYKPTIAVEIYEKVTDTYYRTSEMSLPTPDIDDDDEGDGFQMGQHINLQFEFDIAATGVVIDMSLTPTVREWTDFEVNTDIDPNIYLMLESENVTSVGEKATVVLYTNSAEMPTDLTMGGGLESCSASISGSAPAETSGAHTTSDADLTPYTITIDTSKLADGTTSGTITVTAYADKYDETGDINNGKPTETKITKSFNLTITK